MSNAARLIRAGVIVRAGTNAVIVVTGPTHEEDGTVVAIEVARAFANTGAETVLIDGELVYPRAASLLELNESKLDTLATCLGELRKTGEVPLRPAGRPNLWMAGGRGMDDPGELLASADMAAMVGKLSADNHAVVIIGPPVLESPDTVVLAGIARVTLLLAGLSRTDQTKLQEAAVLLRGTGLGDLSLVVGE
jgi:Mrp family chromosome partitioning ATPase